MDHLTALGGGYPCEQKFYLENLMHRDPGNLALRDAYFQALTALSKSSFGLMYASLPGYDEPIFFRGMTSDIDNMHQIFRHQEYAFEFETSPARILDLGAYGGYAAIYFANRFRNSEIVCVEPSRSNFRLLCMNTMPYDNVRRIHAAVWHQSERLSLVDKIGGDWGNIFGEYREGAGEVTTGFTVSELLDMAGWPNAEYIKCDIEGAELEIFSDPSAADWLDGASYISVETHDRIRPGCMKAVEDALPRERFEHGRRGEFHIFKRILSRCNAVGDETASQERILLTPNTFRVRRFDRVNVPTAPWGFCVLDEETFQLHPNPPGQGPTQLKSYLNLSGQREFSAECRLPEKSLDAVAFSVRLAAAGLTAVDETLIVRPGEARNFRIDIPERQGAYQLILGTEMAPLATSNGFAWAQWGRPCLR